MKLQSKKYLLDIARACRLITEFTARKSQADYGTDVYLRSAVERQFQIAGEALVRLLNTDPGSAARITDYRSIIDFRNIVVHGYDALRAETVWDIIQVNVPVLLREAESLLAEPDDP
ncbi:MAG: DUF86 domain-containing protein [Planctomycetota bacterium]|nr:DUF86 domain-containing protein [Planctomycetota bacterium]